MRFIDPNYKISQQHGQWVEKDGRSYTAIFHPAALLRDPRRRPEAFDDMKEIARICGIEDRIGCHTMRKTFGYHYYRKTHNLALLQQWFYHESPATTLIYIGVTFDDFQSMVDKSPFGGMLDRAVL